MVVSGCGWFFGWLWVVVDGCGWLQMIVGGCGWLWMIVGGYGCFWMVVGCFEWLWMVVSVAYFSIAQLEIHQTKEYCYFLG